MPEDMQPSLFPQSDQTQAEVIDISSVARHIAENAGQPAYEDRTSKAARDQGHGPLDLGSTEHIPGTDIERAQARARGTHPSVGRTKPGRRPFELPGKNGRSNTLPVVTRVEAQKGLSEEGVDQQKKVNAAGAVAARAALKGASQH